MAIPLHNHSQYSILESTVSISELVEKAKEWNLPAIALAEKGNLFSAVEFYKAASKHAIKPIIGCELWIAPNSRLQKKKEPGLPAAFSYLFLAINEKGYHNLCKLSSIGYLEGFYYVPRIDRELLAEYSEGLICLTGGFQSYLYFLAGKEGSKEFQEEVQFLHNLFGDRLYLQLQKDEPVEEEKEQWIQQRVQDHLKKQELLNQKLIDLSKRESIQAVASNETFYLQAEDFKAQEILMNVQSGQPCEIWELDSRGNRKARVPNPKRSILPSRSFYLHSPNQMAEKFSFFPESLKASSEIAERCNVELDFATKHYPVYLPPSLLDKQYKSEEREKEAEKYLWELCQKGISDRYTTEVLAKVQEKYPNQDPIEVVKKRLEQEFQIITSKGMGDYLLIVYDFISWAKSQKIPVGPGRGSAAGSIICYLIGITDIEPLRFHLFFERFINPERVSYPDIDVDICMHRREEVIGYTIQKYGKDKVAQIITFGTMKAKMGIKDVGRMLSVPLAKVNELAKLVPEDPNMNLSKALTMDQDLRAFANSDEDASTIIEMAKKLEGSIRNTSIHAAGLIISANPITEHIPVCTSKDANMVVTQFSMKPVEAVGMLKIDFLGLTTLTSIQKAADYIEANTGSAFDWTSLSLEDKNTYSLLNQGKTLGVFQLESAGMRDLLRQLHIDHFEEIIAVGALYRPGPMDMIPSFIQRKHGEEKIDFDHPLMKDILAETYGVMVYQEQVMQIASKLAGYSLGEGDVLRRAMGKKDHAEMQRQREKFIQGCLANAIEQATAESIFTKIEKFASYGFNKSHAAAYAYLTYVTAYIKANYPKEWMAALMTCAKDDLSKVSKYVQEAKTLDIEMLPPDVNEAGIEFVPTKKGIRFAMSGVKGVGESAALAIMEERAKGAFKGLYDCIFRVSASKVGKKSFELLISAGAFDFTGWTRDALLIFLEQYYDAAVKEQKEKHIGILDLFDQLSCQTPDQIGPPPVSKPTPSIDILHKEKELLGFYLTGHPMDSFKELLQKLSCKSLKDLGEEKEGLVRCAFIIDKIAFKISPKSQRKFAIVTISDGYARFEVPIWNEMYERHSHNLEEREIFYGIFGLENKQGEMRLSLKYMENLAGIKESQVEELEQTFRDLKKRQKKSENFQKKEKKHMTLFLQTQKMRLSHILKLKELFRKYPGMMTVDVRFFEESKLKGIISIAEQWGVNPHEDLLHALRMLPFIKKIEIEEISQDKG